MTCKEAEKLIPIFLNKELSYKDLENFMHHIEDCSECKEELSIQYLITEGATHLEDGSAFDLNRELEHLMEVSQKRVKLHKTFQFIGIGFEILTLAAIITIILIVIL